MSNFRGPNSKDKLVAFTEILKSRGGGFLKEEPNNVAWVVKFVQKRNLNLLPKIMRERAVVNYVTQQQNKYAKSRL